MQTKLASELRRNVINLGAQLTAQRQSQFEQKKQSEQEEIERQIREAPLVAKRLIAGLPQFLKECANAQYSSVYVVYRIGCKPYEGHFPDYATPTRNSSFNRRDMTEYAIRRYMKGTIQHVALWGLKQEFRVGLTSFVDTRGREIEAMMRNHQGVLPFYMPGMFESKHIPQSGNADFLFFAW